MTETQGGYKLKDGPSTIEIPQYHERVCNGCKYLNKEAMMRGHRTVTDNYSCLHPDFEGEKQWISDDKGGRLIHFNHEGYCNTPDWCPYLTSSKNTL